MSFAKHPKTGKAVGKPSAPYAVDKSTKPQHGFKRPSSGKSVPSLYKAQTYHASMTSDVAPLQRYASEPDMETEYDEETLARIEAKINADLKAGIKAEHAKKLEMETTKALKTSESLSVLNALFSTTNQAIQVLLYSNPVQVDSQDDNQLEFLKLTEPQRLQNTKNHLRTFYTNIDQEIKSLIIKPDVYNSWISNVRTTFDELVKKQEKFVLTIYEEIRLRREKLETQKRLEAKQRAQEFANFLCRFAPAPAPVVNQSNNKIPDTTIHSLEERLRCLKDALIIARERCDDCESIKEEIRTVTAELNEYMV
jgi:hypothetical protein